jgi:hypothetical protein
MPCAVATTCHHAEATVVDHDGEVAVTVRTQDTGAVAGKPREQGGVGMPVRVVRPHAHESHRRVDGVKQIRVLICRPVVGHLEHLGAYQGTFVSRQHVVLLLGLGVAREKHGDAATGRPEDEAVVVRIRPRPGQRPYRCDHLHRQPAACVGPSETGLGDGGGRAPRRPAHPCLPRGRIVEGWDDDTAEMATPEDTRDTGDVVGVEMRDHQQWHGPHVEPPQAGIDLYRVGSGVDDHGLAGVEGKNDRITLADGAGDDHRVHWRPPWRQHAHRDRAGGHAKGDHDDKPTHSAVSTGAQQRDHQHRQQHAPGGAARTR